MKYPQTKTYNDILLNNSMIYFYGLIINFLIILSCAFLGFRKIGILSVLFFIITELHIFNDIILNNYYKLKAQQNNNIFDMFYNIPLEHFATICMLLGIIALSLKPRKN